MKILFIYNPVSGKSGSRINRFGKALFELGKGDNEITVYQMKYKGDGARYLKTVDANAYDLILGCGGDGTLHEIVDGALNVGYTHDIGYVPFGSTNDFANNLGIESNNAVDIILNHNVQLLDVGKFNNEHFNYVAAFGFFTDIPYSTPQNVKNSLGYMAYLLEGIKELTDMKSYRFRCETDSAIIEDDILVGIITNTLSVAGVKLKDHMAKLDDGMLEYVFIKYPRTLLDIQNTIFALVNNKFDNRYMYYGHSENFKISSDLMQWTLDGEDGGTHDTVNIITEKQALKIIVGND